MFEQFVFNAAKTYYDVTYNQGSVLRGMKFFKY